MDMVRRFFSGASRVAMGGLAVVGLIALFTVMGRYPARIAIVLAVALIAAVVLGAVTGLLAADQEWHDPRTRPEGDAA